MFLTFRFCSYIKRQLHDRGFVKLVVYKTVPYALDNVCIFLISCY